MNKLEITREQVYSWLDAVKDPEIPVLSLVDLGVIISVALENNHVRIVMTPTFVGCPALDMMKMEIGEILYKHGVEEVDIEISYKKPWNSDLISEKGKLALKKFGLAPPPSRELFADLDFLERAICPRCEGTNTDLRNIFGSTLCRSLYYCNDCKDAFEQFKPL